MGSLKIITSNIRFANSSDGVHDWSVRLPQLVEIYESYGPDLLGTQEGRQGQIKELEAKLKGMVLLAGHRQWIDVRMYPCLYVNPETIEVHKTGDIWLSETPEVAGSISFDSAFPRLCTWAEVTVKKSGTKLMVVNTHLDHILTATRERQIEVLISEVKKVNSLPLIIMGDFNESPLTVIKEKLMAAFDLKDPWAEKNYAEETSHHAFLGDQAAPGYRIDWILIPDNFECTDLKLEKKCAEGIYPSDHYPLLATVIPR